MAADQEPRYIPKPVAAVMANIDAVQRAYLECRSAMPPSAAVSAALRKGLEPDTFAEVFAFMSGERDATYGPSDGADFARSIADHLEGLYDAISSYAARVARRQRMDVVDLAEDLATDPILMGGYQRAMQVRDHDGATSVLDDAVGLICQRASGALTKVGGKVKIEQAAKVLSLMASKAARANSESPQAAWCSALVIRLRPLYP